MNAAIDIPSNALPHIRKWAKSRKQSVTIFDLETTTYAPLVKWFGITEIGMLTVSPDGQLKAMSELVNPERKIPPKVQELTGIRNEDVADQPSWGVWAPRLHQLARDHVMVGYYSSKFDCIGVLSQNARYGIKNTEFCHSLDVMCLPGVQGKLENAAGSFGISSDIYHRALADVWVTAQLADKIAELHGLDVLESTLGTVAQRDRDYSSRKIREEELLATYKTSGHLPDIEKFATKHGIKSSTAMGDVMRLVRSGDIPDVLLVNEAVQKWLEPRLPAAIHSCWIGEEQRLKPLMVLLEKDAPDGFDYTQLRLGINRWKNVY